MAFSVNFWGSHPDDDNDDCWYGEEYGTLEEAEKEFAAPVKDSGVAYVELDGPDVYKVRENPGFEPTEDDMSDWHNEIAMQAGMAFGCQGYNDVMGY